MIDPKLNEIPVSRAGAGTQTAEATTAEAQQAERLRRNRAGLSINDTIAGDALLSVGSKGVDVSGVESGAGAGAGSTAVTPGISSSPAPTIVPGARSTGTTARADSLTGQSASGTPQTEDLHGFEDHEVANRAYECWCERGRPDGSPEVDWHQAIQDLRERRRSDGSIDRSSAASA